MIEWKGSRQDKDKGLSFYFSQQKLSDGMSVARDLTQLP
jgi:hypothetical protein